MVNDAKSLYTVQTEKIKRPKISVGVKMSNKSVHLYDIEVLVGVHF